MVDVAQVAGQYWYLFLLPFIAALAIAAVALYMLRKGRRTPPEEGEMERARERLSEMVRERTANLERSLSELRESEARLSEAQRIAQLGSWEWDMRTNALLASDELFRIFGMQPKPGGMDVAEFVGRIHPEDRRLAEEAMGAARKGKAISFYHRMIRQDGAIRTLYVNGEVKLDDSGRPAKVTGTTQDVTERKEAEEKYRTVIETSNDLIWMLDLQGNVTYANRKALDAGGFTLEDVRAKHFSFRIPKEDVPRIQKLVAETLSGKPVAYEASFYTKDGRLVTMSVNTTPIYEAGRVVGVASFGQDITGRKRAEELVKNYTDRLEFEVKKRTAELSAEKDKVEKLLALKDEFIRNVSHELKTPLSVIIGNLLLLKDLAPAGRGWSRMVELLERNARRLGNSIDNVLELSIVSTEEAGRERVHMKDLLNGIYGQYAPIAELKGIKLTLDAEQLVVDGDAKMLRLAIANLVDNAIKFTEKGSVGIALKATDGNMSLSVKDTGSGISPGNQKRLFEKFFKADPSAPGTGIGLAIAKEIVNKHNGEIRVKSALGKGSTFEIILPRGVGK